MIELVIVVLIIGVIAAIAAPRLSQGATRAAQARLAIDQRTLQDAVDRYAAEHGRNPARNADGSVASELLVRRRLTERTDETGDPSPDGTFGPYLRDIPGNPFTDCPDLAVGPFSTSTGCAWRIDPATGLVRPDHAGDDHAAEHEPAAPTADVLPTTPDDGND